MPSGKRLVVEFVSASIYVPPGLRVIGSNFFGDELCYVLPVFTGTDNRFNPLRDIYLISQPVKLYVEAGKKLSATFVESASGDAAATYTFIGYLVDAP